MRDALDTPWTSAGISPALPPLAVGPVSATAAPLGAMASATPFALVTPWGAADVRLPARATALPVLAPSALLPAQRPVIDLRDPSRVLS